MRTIKEVLIENPNAMFSFGSTEGRVYDGEDILEQIQYSAENAEPPIVTYCKESYFSMSAQDIIDCQAEQWGDAYEDWELDCSDELRDKLQAILDEIVAYNKSRNISYFEGEELDISQEWEQVNGVEKDE